jgi:succinate dehydrogenase flavin-adding protein (antitoxin of CptAB toxin-antitoxin module)
LHYQAADGRLVTKDILVNFLDYEIKLTPAQQQTYTALERYIESLDTSKSKVSDLKVILENLRRSLIDGLSTSAEVVTVRNFVATEKPDLSEQQKTQLEDILIKLDTESTKAA